MLEMRFASASGAPSQLRDGSNGWCQDESANRREHALSRPIIGGRQFPNTKAPARVPPSTTVRRSDRCYPQLSTAEAPSTFTFAQPTRTPQTQLPALAAAWDGRMYPDLITPSSKRHPPSLPPPLVI